MSKFAPALLSAVLLALFGGVLACKPEAAPPPPAAATASPGPQYTFGNGTAGGTMGTAGTTGGLAPATGAGSTAAGGQTTGQGAGCVGDAEPVPNEAGLRECCTKLGWGRACAESACWDNGAVAKFKAQMQPGGECAQ